MAACALLSYYLISHYLVQSVRVIGMSMVPTLHDSQLYLLNRWVLHVRAPARSEIVVLRDPTVALPLSASSASPAIPFICYRARFSSIGKKLAESYLST